MVTRITRFAVAAGVVASGTVLYLEGYLFDPLEAQEAFRRAAQIAHDAGRTVSVTLSDSFCVERHRDAFLDLVEHHVDLLFAGQTLRFADPRRFGVVLWQAAEAPPHPLLAVLGIEPLGDEFTADWLFAATRRRAGPIKPLLMDSHLVVGIGNIYASESLFRAGISPLRAANRISRERYKRLVPAIRQTLADAIAAGGSSIRDYVHSDGGAGCFQVECAVYDRAGAPCRRCAGVVRQVRQGGRSTFYCPACQH